MTLSIAPAEISFVFQGPVGAAEFANLAQAIVVLRKLAPGSEIIVSTWTGTERTEQLGADQIVFSSDPGPLPGIRGHGEIDNNVNRQLVTSFAGLATASRQFAAKLRTDCSLTSLDFLESYNRLAKASEILTCNFFTVDPRMFEQVPFHISDWFQFGPLSDMTLYWSAPFMSLDTATYYSNHSHASHSTYLDRKFACRLAVEQHIATAYAAKLGYEVPAFHNDNRMSVLAAHDRFLREQLIIVDLPDSGLEFPKYDWVLTSGFQQLNCISHMDWLDLYGASEPQDISAIAARKFRKRNVRIAYQWAGPLLRASHFAPLKKLINIALAGKG